MKKPGPSRPHRGRLMAGSIGLAGLLLFGLAECASDGTSGVPPSGLRPIESWSPVVPRNAPQRPFRLWVTPEPALLPTARPVASRPPVTRKVPKPVIAPQPRTHREKGDEKPLAHRLSGQASWYCRAGRSICHYRYPDTPGFDAYAAAGPALRRAIGPGWRGSVVTVNGIRVRLVDWCQCYRGLRHEKAIDLYYDVFARTGSSVVIRW